MPNRFELPVPSTHVQRFARFPLASPADDVMCHTALEHARDHYGFCARYTLAPCTTAHYADFAFDIMTVATCAQAGNEEAKRFVEFLKSESDYYKRSTTR